jgi:hypothetical protein
MSLLPLPALLADAPPKLPTQHMRFELTTATVRVGAPDTNWSSPLPGIASDEEQRAALLFAVQAGWPVWLEFRATGNDAEKLLDRPDAWEPSATWVFEKDASIAELLKSVDEARNARRPALEDVLDVLPLLHELGATRARGDIPGGKLDVEPELLTVLAFIPLEERDAALEPVDQRQDPPIDAREFRFSHFVASRMNVAVLDNVVISLQLPDPSPCAIGEPSNEEVATLSLARSPLVTVRSRYLPTSRDVCGCDIAIAMLKNAVEFYDAVARRLHLALDDLEHDFYQHDDGDPEGLREYFRRLQQLGQTIENIEHDIRHLLRRMPPDLGADDLLIRRLLRSYYGSELDRVCALQTEIRMASETMASVLSTKQLTASQEDQKRSERFQRDATLVASAILVPALVASIYGANVQLPAKETWWALGELVGLMIFGAVLTWWYIHRPRDDQRFVRSGSSVARQKRIALRRFNPMVVIALVALIAAIAAMAVGSSA